MLPLAAAALGVWWTGGYSDGSRLGFGVVAVAVATAAVAADRNGARAMLREPVVLVLIALAVAGAASAVWTLGPAGRTLRWGLVAAGYAGVAVAAGIAARGRGGTRALAAGVAVLAATAAAASLGAAALREAPYAERIADVWRPGGPFEYPPALALLQVSALPALLAGMAGRSRLVAGASAVGMALAGGVLALSASRAALAMAVAVAGAAIAFPVATVHARRGLVAAALGVAAAAAVAVQVAAGGATAAGAGGGRPAVIATLAAVCLLAAGWPAIRPRQVLVRQNGSRRRLRAPALGAVAVALAGLALVAGSLAYGAAADRGRGAAGGFLHGRSDTWGAALRTFADRPLLGTGADAFLSGSARHQHGQTILFAHDLPLELAAELGVVGIALAVALYGTSARLLWRARAAPAAWLLGPAFAAFLAAGLVDWPWHLAGAGAVWSIAAGGLAGAAMPLAKLPAGRRALDGARAATEPLEGDTP